MLQPIDSQRYLRQMTLSGFGEAGQAALQAARVLLIDWAVRQLSIWLLPV